MNVFLKKNGISTVQSTLLTMLYKEAEGDEMKNQKRPFSPCVCSLRTHIGVWVLGFFKLTKSFSCIPLAGYGLDLKNFLLECLLPF